MALPLCRPILKLALIRAHEPDCTAVLAPHREIQILRVLWDRGPSTVGEVRQTLDEERDTGYTTSHRETGGGVRKAERNPSSLPSDSETRTKQSSEKT